MKKKIDQHVEQLFNPYKKTEQLNDLKDEIKANLLARINDSIASGFSKEEAFAKAIEELGDLSELAEEISDKTKYEFLTTTLKKNKKSTFGIGFASATGILLIGIIGSLIAYFQSDEWFITLSTLFPFATVSIALFVFLGCMMETNDQYAMKPIRAALYTIASILLTAGIFIALIIYTQKTANLFTYHQEALFISITSFIPFVIGAICLFVFLAITEKDRQKPNVWETDELNIKNSAVYSSLCGALWIFAVGVFITVGFFGSWKFSWLIFIFAVGFQVLLDGYFFKKPAKKQVL